MMVQDWLDKFAERIADNVIVSPQAAAVVAFARRHAAHVASFVEARRQNGLEIVILDIRTGAPQHPVYPIRRTERVGILFTEEEAQPFVTMLRDDFPDTEHQQLVPEGWPLAICLDDRPWAEARLTWTPAELIQRIVSWFWRAARGELHDARQPVDPIFMGSQLSFIVARSILTAGGIQNLIAEHDAEFPNILRVSRAAEAGTIMRGMEPLCIAGYAIEPTRMKRLKYAPTNFGSLADMLSQRGIDLFDDLRRQLDGWIAEGECAAWRLNARFAVIVEMPIVSPRGEQQDGVDLRAFLTARSAGDIAVALGIAQKADPQLSKVGYVKTIGHAAIDSTAAAAIETQTAEVHLEFERDLATRLSGRTIPDDRKAVLAGAGAMGSHLADSLAREGRFRWTVIDDDRLFPHNLARHIAHKERVTKPKARILADYLNATLSDPGQIAEAIPANVLATGEDGTAVEKALVDADLIIDVTASVFAERALSDHPARARRVSAFFNPSGEAAVLLAEPAGRALTLRDLEAQYYGQILRSERLTQHLGKPAETVAYTGACRAITNRIPQSRAAILSGLAAAGLSKAVDSDDGAIAIWSLAQNGEVACDAAVPEPVWRYTALHWTITVDTGLVERVRAMRDARLPAETGGVLFGLVDIPARSIHLVDAAPAPPDSIEEPEGFVRGVEGVDENMESVRRRTAGQVRYVGEWHSHPPRLSARPSAIDALQIDWLAALMGMDSIPALMVIAADNELAVIFANERAAPQAQEEAARPAA